MGYLPPIVAVHRPVEVSADGRSEKARRGESISESSAYAQDLRYGRVIVKWR